MEEKETRNKFWKGVLVGALVTAFCGLIAVGMAAGIWLVAKRASISMTARNDTVQEETAALDMDRISTKLAYMQALVDEYYLFDDEDIEKAEDWIYTGFIYSLGDPYSAYYNAEEYASLNEDLEGAYCGIGVQVSQNLQTGIVTVVKVFPDGPAKEAGMLPGDILYKVKDILVSGEDLNLLISEHIKGEEGTTVPIEVYRESTDEYIQMDVERRMVENMTVEYDMLDGHIGYVAVSSFDEPTAEQFRTAIDVLESKGMEGLIVDLRNNGGGLLDAAEDMLDYVLPDGMDAVSFKGKGVEDFTYVTDSVLFDGEKTEEHQVDVPMVLLVNGESASASEVFTGALRDNDWATIVGTQTFGKGIAQGVFEMADGSALKLTTAYYYVPSGECIHEVGIAPDLEVDLDEELKSMITVPKEDDNQLKAAVDVLLKGEDEARRLVEESQAAAEEEAAPVEETSDGSELAADGEKETEAAPEGE